MVIAERSQTSRFPRLNFQSQIGRTVGKIIVVMAESGLSEIEQQNALKVAGKMAKKIYSLPSIMTSFLDN